MAQQEGWGKVCYHRFRTRASKGLCASRKLEEKTPEQHAVVPYSCLHPLPSPKPPWSISVSTCWDSFPGISFHSPHPSKAHSQPYVVLSPLLSEETACPLSPRAFRSPCNILATSASPGTSLGEDLMPRNPSHNFLWKGLQTYPFHSFRGRQTDWKAKWIIRGNSGLRLMS